MAVVELGRRPGGVQSGNNRNGARKDIKTGDWKYRIEGQTAERRQVAVVFCLRPDAAVFITVFERIA